MRTTLPFAAAAVSVLTITPLTGCRTLKNGEHVGTSADRMVTNIPVKNDEGKVIDQIHIIDPQGQIPQDFTRGVYEMLSTQGEIGSYEEFTASFRESHAVDLAHVYLHYLRQEGLDQDGFLKGFEAAVNASSEAFKAEMETHNGGPSVDLRVGGNRDQLSREPAQP